MMEVNRLAFAFGYLLSIGMITVPMLWGSMILLVMSARDVLGWVSDKPTVPGGHHSVPRVGAQLMVAVMLFEIALRIRILMYR